MGYRHTNNLSRCLALEARGKYALITIEPAYEDERKLPQRRYELHTRAGVHVATMTAQSLPGCCGVCVLHSFSGTNEGLKDFIDIGHRAAKRAGYGTVLLTLRALSPILDLLPRPGEEDHRMTFRNGKTDNLVTIVATNIPQAPKKKARVERIEGE